MLPRFLNVVVVSNSLAKYHGNRLTHEAGFKFQPLSAFFLMAEGSKEVETPQGLQGF